MHALLIREPASEDGVFGLMTLFGEADESLGTWCVAEEDWRDNAPKISCIPAGSYVCQRVVSPKFGDVFQVMEVPGRSHILIHSGNTEEDVEGCIMLGVEFGLLDRADEDMPGHPVRRKRAVLRSKAALKWFMSLLTHTAQFDLIIRWDTDPEDA
jgi:hypothetical protein